MRVLCTLLLTLVALTGCKSDPPGVEKGAEPEAAAETTRATDEPTQDQLVPDVASLEPTGPAVPTVKGAEPAPEWPRYEKVEDIPEDIFAEVMTKNEQGRPSVFTLSHDVVLQGTPCQAKQRISVYVNGDTLSGCTLAVDFAVAEGLALANGAEVKMQPDGSFAGFVLRAPQMLQGLPVAENLTIYWTKASGLSSVPLAIDTEVAGHAFKAGTQLTFTGPELRGLRSARLKGEHTIAGKTFPDGHLVEFDETQGLIEPSP